MRDKKLTFVNAFIHIVYNCIIYILEKIHNNIIFLSYFVFKNALSKLDYLIKIYVFI